MGAHRRGPSRRGRASCITSLFTFRKKAKRGRFRRDGAMSHSGRLGPRRSGPGLSPGHGPARAQGSPRLRLEMHYTPNGTAAKDRSSVGITFAEKPPRYELLIGEFANMAIEVPPHDPHYTAEATFRFAPTPASSASPRTCTGAARITATR